MLDAKALLDQLLSAGARGGMVSISEDSPLHPSAAPAQGASGVVSLLLGARTGRHIGEAALHVGAFGLIGGLAHKAWSDWKDGARPADARVSPDFAELPPPAGSPFSGCALATEADRASVVLIRAMVAASRSAGGMDKDETSRLKEAVAHSTLDRNMQTVLIDVLDRPDDVAEIVAEVGSPELAAEVYLAARLVVDADSAEERGFLKRLAAALELDPGLVAHLDANARSAKDDHPTV